MYKRSNKLKHVANTKAAVTHCEEKQYTIITSEVYVVATCCKLQAQVQTPLVPFVTDLLYTANLYKSYKWNLDCNLSFALPSALELFAGFKIIHIKIAKKTVDSSNLKKRLPRKEKSACSTFLRQLHRATHQSPLRLGILRCSRLSVGDSAPPPTIAGIWESIGVDKVGPWIPETLNP